MSPFFLGGFHIRLSAGAYNLTLKHEGANHCDGCNRRSMIKRAYHALLRFKYATLQ